MLVKLYPMFKKGFALGLLMLATGVANAQYCTPVAAAGTPCIDMTTSPQVPIRINTVTTTGGIININNPNGTCTAPGYTYYSGTGNTVRQNAGSNVTVNITANNSPTTLPRAWKVLIWVDWNRNDTFDDNGAVYNAATNPKSERMYESPSTAISGPNWAPSFAVPMSAANGMTRMRIRAGTQSNLGFPPSAPFFPCPAGNFLYGEVEDYDFEVINPCNPPASVNFNNITDRSLSITWVPKLNAKFYEYLITKTKGIPASGNVYTTNTTLNLPDVNNPIECNTKYYFYVRSICDTGKGSTPEFLWDKSAWREDSFTTNPCCYMPEVTINNITGSTAIASWTPVPSVVKYEYVISVDTNMAIPQVGTITTMQSIFLQGLSPKQDYIFWLRALCSPTPYSTWRRTTFLTQPSTGVETAVNSTFDVQAYPNPVKDVVTVEVVKGIRGNNAKLTLTDVTGKVLMEKDANDVKMNINMADRQAGVYILKYSDDNNSRVLKITKQ